MPYRTSAAVAALLGLACPARANMRPPHINESGFSGHLRAAGAAPILVDENMDIGFDTDENHLARTAVFTITYTIEQPGPATDLPLEFLGIAIVRPAIEVNGQDVDYDMRTDRRAQRDLLSRLVAQRCGYRPGVGRIDDLRADLLERLAPRGPRVACEQPEQLRAAVEKADLRNLHVYDKLDTVAFVAHLQPGRNRIMVAYRQPTFVAEGPYKTSAFGVHEAALGFDYLLYPAKSWKIDPHFRLQVAITPPWPRVPATFGSKEVPPLWRCNLPLTEATSQEIHHTYLKGIYQGIPADLLTFVYAVP
jgi:hypothetical protein